MPERLLHGDTGLGRWRQEHRGGCRPKTAAPFLATAVAAGLLLLLAPFLYSGSPDADRNAWQYLQALAIPGAMAVPGHDDTHMQSASAATHDGEYGGFVSFGKKVFSWTDTVHITIVAPDHNFDPRAVDSIGGTEYDPIRISTREGTLERYKLVETGPNTGIFAGEITLIGFDHDADGDSRTGADGGGFDNPQRKTGGSGPTSGHIKAGSDDAITVSFEYTDGHTIVDTAPIRWNIGQIEWSESSYPASRTGTVRVIDPDMNLNPNAVNSFEVDVWSDSDAGGISLVVTEKSESSGIFEGAVTFTTDDRSSGHRLKVAEGDVVTASYKDNTLPNPYSEADEQSVTAASQIGALVAPLDRVRTSELRITDGFNVDMGSSISEGQQVQVSTKLTNQQERKQQFVYIIVIKDAESGAVSSLSWVTGHIEAGQSLSVSTSWMPEAAGLYDVTAFVWESLVRPSALSPPSQIMVTVN